MFGFEFANPKYFLLLVLLLPMILWYVFKEKKSHADLQFSSLRAFRGIRHAGRVWLRHVLFALKVLAIVFLVTALARPQSSNSWQTYTSEGIDIVLGLDISTSMLARDFSPDRLEAAKEVATKFILERPQDRIGLVVFAGESFTQCPLTTDQAVLVNLLREVQSGMIEDGTAIGLGLANAVNRLKDSPAKSKVVILLTDGVNNRGAIAPVTAAELAKTYGIRVYTIGVGTYGEAPYPVPSPFGVQLQNMRVEIDEDVLRQIATVTGGQYFRATDNSKLEQIYKEIDQLEKSKMEVKHFSKKQEQYFWFGLIGVLLLVGEALLRYTLLRKIP
ncbi:vWA domain-containing protein [Culturomica massiliensis]|jgi:Ca-activated chloride channel family protein|uniref:vWA domain-containing protein n=1 Tax=Culturomica massiliensis TaxID=1841857 RepID=UPI00033D9DBC|nr:MULTISPECIES: VWA domain-containing protein [Odoribacteraceae]RHV96137.1 VWA domain-containing protein [Odoribacter sp. OF09-27XD]CCZ06825.1 n-terminal double-transmembrane domain-containing protein [Odoribacter sp. CAG:788]